MRSLATAHAHAWTDCGRSYCYMAHLWPGRHTFGVMVSRVGSPFAAGWYKHHCDGGEQVDERSVHGVMCVAHQQRPTDCVYPCAGPNCPPKSVQCPSAASVCNPATYLSFPCKVQATEFHHPQLLPLQPSPLPAAAYLLQLTACPLMQALISTPCGGSPKRPGPHRQPLPCCSSLVCPPLQALEFHHTQWRAPAAQSQTSSHSSLDGLRAENRPRPVPTPTSTVQHSGEC